MTKSCSLLPLLTVAAFKGLRSRPDREVMTGLGEDIHASRERRNGRLLKDESCSYQIFENLKILFLIVLVKDESDRFRY